MRIVVLSDTHIRDSGSRRLTDATVRELERAELILHAGDVVEPGMLRELATYASTYAVLGNNDLALRGVLPETFEQEIEGVHIAMLHDSGPRAGREGRMKRRFPDAELVIFGHSHIPWDAEGIDGQHLLNPGSPTERRAQPHRTLATIDVVAGRFTARIVEVD